MDERRSALLRAALGYICEIPTTTLRKHRPTKFARVTTEIESCTFCRPRVVEKGQTSDSELIYSSSVRLVESPK